MDKFALSYIISMVTIGTINYTYRHNDMDYMDWLLMITVWRN